VGYFLLVINAILVICVQEALEKLGLKTLY